MLRKLIIFQETTAWEAPLFILIFKYYIT